jgi:hypothetical protein
MTDPVFAALDCREHYLSLNTEPVRDYDDLARDAITGVEEFLDFAKNDARDNRLNDLINEPNSPFGDEEATCHAAYDKALDAVRRIMYDLSDALDSAIEARRDLMYAQRAGEDS